MRRRSRSEPHRLGARVLRWALAIGVLAAIVLLLLWKAPWRREGAPAGSGHPPTAPNRLFVCIWNVENLFDDRDDPSFVDDIEDWMGRVSGVSDEKCRRLTHALRQLNDGRGPDVIGLTEVENRWAIERLRSTLNEGRVGSDRYEYVVHRDNRQGRRIEPAVLSRVPIEAGEADGQDGERARSRFGWRRILHAVVTPDSRPLHLLLSHWTSRRTPNSDRQRAGYARALRAEVDRLRARDPKTDLLIVGDFNDEPESPLVRDVLGASWPPPRVGPLPDGSVVNLMLGIEPARRATMVYRGVGQTFDQILATNGLFDSRGWRVRIGSARVVDEPRVSVRGAARPTPLRFGSRGTRGRRGFSDHFAVTVVLEADDPAAAAAPAVR